jgi:hypothetical protein
MCQRLRHRPGRRSWPGAVARCADRKRLSARFHPQPPIGAGNGAFHRVRYPLIPNGLAWAAPSLRGDGVARNHSGGPACPVERARDRSQLPALVRYSPAGGRRGGEGEGRPRGAHRRPLRSVLPEVGSHQSLGPLTKHPHLPTVKGENQQGRSTDRVANVCRKK